MKRTGQPGLQKPRLLDVSNAKKVVQRLINENKEWIKDMAKK